MLASLLARYRIRLGAERVLQFGVRGVWGSAAATIALLAVGWLSGAAIGPLFPWLGAAPFLAAIGYALVRWPSQRETARVMDERLRLADRLATAVEVVERQRHGRFDGLQVRDALTHAAAAPSSWLALNARTRNEALGALAMLALAGALSGLLPSMPRPAALALAPAQEGPSAPATTETAEPELPPVEAGVSASTSTQPVEAIQRDPNLDGRVRQEQAQRSALDALANALGSVSAAQQAADAIEQGNYGAARDQLQTLGEQADQLSGAAKQQLADALQQAANATAQTDRQLADRERQAAQAFSRSNYGEQRQALRNLADQVQRSGSRSVSSDQLQRDAGRLAAQTAASSGGSTAPAAASGAGGAQAGAGRSGNGSSSQGQPGGAGVGTGSDPNVLGDPSRLDTAGSRVEVPTRLSNGPGVRPATGDEDQATTDPSMAGRGVSELAQTQSTGQVAPEQNLVRGEQRPVVRGYFR